MIRDFIYLICCANNILTKCCTHTQEMKLKARRIDFSPLNCCGFIDSKTKTKTNEYKKKKGCGGDIDPVHRIVNGGPDAQHPTGASGVGRSARRWQFNFDNDFDRQPEFGDGRGGVHHLVHTRIRPALLGVAKQVEVFQRSPQRD